MVAAGSQGSSESTAWAELTHSQTQIWVGQQLHPQSPLYNMAFAFIFEAELRSDLFCAAWLRVMVGSDALRTRITSADNGGLPRIRQGEASPTEVLDFSQLAAPEEDFRRWCQERCARPLAGTDPDNGPLVDSVLVDSVLVDSVLVRLGPERTGWYLNQHHLIADAWSTRLLYRQVAAEYSRLLCGEEVQRADGESVALAPNDVPYYATASEVQERAGRPAERAAAGEHWARRQEHRGQSISFYGRRTAPVGTASVRTTLELDTADSRALDRLAGQEGFLSLSGDLSRFALVATLLTGWLYRISGNGDLRFDAPVAGRPTPQSKRALGLFIEMFPFAVSVGPHDTFRTLGARCLEEAKRFLRYALPGLSNPGGATASSVVLNFFPATFGPFADVPAAVEWIHPGHGDSVHALRIQVHDVSGSGRYTMHFDANEGALPEDLRSRCLDHFEAVLKAFLEDPDRRIAAVDVRRAAPSPAEGLQAAPLPLPERTVVAEFEDRARLEPHRVALRQGGTEVSFADLLERSEALATTLVALGVAPGDRVAIYSRRSIAAVVALLAILRARAAYVPIGPAVPRTRLEHLLRDSGARVLVVGDGVGAVSTPSECLAMSVQEGIQRGSGQGLDRPGPDLGDLAYLMYTSGSTGPPKGVLIEHGGLADYLAWAAATYVRGDRLNFPLFTSLAFDLTVTSLFLPLITGGTLEIYPEPEGPVDTALVDVARANAVDFIKLTPSHLALLARLGLADSQIRRMVVGGEALPASLAATVHAQLHDHLELYNEYGPTEAVVGCVAHRDEPTAPAGTRSITGVPIGIPAAHVEVEILNEAQTPVPEGVPGELWIARHGLARGYHARPRLTAEFFRPRETSRRPGERRYRTGDRVRRTDGGHLEYLGRLDRQLKVSGIRVEPGEIEAVLLSVPNVTQCAVLARRRRGASSPAASPAAEKLPACIRCGLPANYPGAHFDADGVCTVCRTYELVKHRAQAYFKTMDDLRAIFEESARTTSSEYDCMLLLSGGKDSTYALCRLVALGLSVYAFTLDNGFISEGAKDNIRRVTQQLGVPVEFATTPAMNAIFRDSLRRFSNVCNGCFKTIYTLSMARAREMGIPIIVTGLSRGQMFETRLTEEMFAGGRTVEEIDDAVLAARKVYHRLDDEVARSLDVNVFQGDRIFEELRIVDFYRYCDVALEEVYSHLQREVPWLRPQDTGRSTNCLINDVGIYVHKAERGYHNYALPYSWDVRLGHKSRIEALEELDDEIDPDFVRRTLADIGYNEEHVATGAEQITLEAFYVAPEDLSEEELRRQLGERLPPPLIPTHLTRVSAIPLTANGKVDEKLLARESAEGTNLQDRKPYRPPEGPVEEYLVDLWQEELATDRVGCDDSFFALGGTSLNAMQVMIRLCREFEIDLPLDTMFSHPTLGALAKVAEDRILADVGDLL